MQISARHLTFPHSNARLPGEQEDLAIKDWNTSSGKKKKRLQEPKCGAEENGEKQEERGRPIDPLARLASLAGPTADIEQMVEEIDAGRR